ncbi:MAG TPA: Fe-S cluster assembly protein SufD [Caulobacteraceae bacterium]|nr:Fe-S cluster assembly protein SufD [Caulobacteraceae bacterium]
MSLARAITTGDLAELPSRRDEDWRWSDIAGLVRELPPRSKTFKGELAPGVFDALAEEVVPVVNGEVRAGIAIGSGGEHVVAVRFIAAEGAGAHTATPKLHVEKGRVVLLETYEGQGPYVSEIDFRLDVEAEGEIERIVLADESADAVSVAHCDVRLAPGAKFSQTVVTVGGCRQRLETRVQNPGGGASARLDGIYLLADKRHADITTVVDHLGLGGSTDQLVKGRVDDQARAVFQGRIVVAEGADKTDARMGHHALLLSDRAEVDAKPELEIYADDVACAHGNTVGALDEEALFYAQQRGIPEAEARAMLTEAFIGEVVDRIGHEGAREVVRSWIAARLGGTR